MMSRLNAIFSVIKNSKLNKFIKANKIFAGLINNTINIGLRVYGKKLSKNYDIKETIIISGAHRGGTTWLLEVLLNSIPFSCGISEPLSLTTSIYQDERLKKLNFSSKQYIAFKQEWKEAEILIKDILTGANINLFNVYSDSILEYFKAMSTANVYIVKFCRANRMLEWMVDKFKLKHTILLIRHPCAVVASQLSHGGWNHILKNNNSEYPDFSPEFIKKEPWIEKIVKSIKTTEEKMALSWCLDHYIVLSASKPYQWILTTYEKLVQDGESEIKSILNQLGYKAPMDIDKYLHKPSSSTSFDSNVMQGGNRLTTWKNKLSKDQIKRILAIVSKFGLDFYTDDLEPDYERLHKNPVIRYN